MLFFNRLTYSTLITFVTLSSASVFFPNIQPITGFSSTCTAAYDIVVTACSPNDFAGIGGTGSCSYTCQQQLNIVQTVIQASCTNQKASSKSLIGQFFLGNAVSFLCGTGSGTQTSTTMTTSTALSVSSSITSASSSPAPSSTDSTSDMTTSTTQSSSSTQTSSPSTVTVTPTQSVVSLTSTLTFDTSSCTQPITKTTAGSGPATVTANSGGGSPFDGAANKASNSGLEVQEKVLLVCLVLAAYVVTFR